MPPADDSWKAEYKLWPLGMVSQVLRSGAAVALDKWASRSKKALPRLSWEKTPLVGSWEHQIANNHYREAYQQRGWHCLQHAYEMHGEGGDEEIKRFSIAARTLSCSAAKPVSTKSEPPDAAKSTCRPSSATGGRERAGIRLA